MSVNLCWTIHRDKAEEQRNHISTGLVTQMSVLVLARLHFFFPFIFSFIVLGYSRVQTVLSPREGGCKLLHCRPLRPVPKKKMRTEETTKERQRKHPTLRPLLFCRGHERGYIKGKRLLLVPNTQPLSLLPPLRFSFPSAPRAPPLLVSFYTW